MIWGLLFFLILVLHLGIGGIVFIKNFRNITNQSFFLLTFFLASWMAVHFLQNEPPFKNFAEFLFRLDFFLGIFLCSTFYFFTQLFPQPVSISFTKKLFIFIPSFLFSILSFNNLIIKQIHFHNGVIDGEPGILFGGYFLIALAYVGGGIIKLFFNFKKSLGIQKTQILYVFLGMAITSGTLFFVNLILGAIFNLSLHVYRATSAASLSFTIFTALAITRYHLFGIEVILTELLVGVIGILLIIQTFTSPTLFWKVVNGIIFTFFSLFGY
ncbi:MAG: hypothetical protein NC935_08175, partial [Candidatus Omnitrophica bacterium]|nr:hypothetical protein [Candidatus Omnitrophota bacterium]